DVALDREIAFATAAARIGAIEHRIVLGFQVRSALDSHCAADMDVGSLDLALGKAERGEEIEGRGGKVFPRNTELVAAEVLAERQLLEGELDAERGRQR